MDIARDGAISLDREKVTLNELKTQSAKDAKKWCTIRADKDVPDAKVIEAVEALKAAHSHQSAHSHCSSPVLKSVGPLSAPRMADSSSP